MNFKLTIILAFVAITGIFAVALIYKREKAPETPDARTVFPATLGDVTAIKFTQNGDLQVALAAQAENKWMITQPMSAPANDSAENAAQMLHNLTYISKFTPEASGPNSLATVGLESAKYAVEMTNKAGNKWTLLLGKRNSTGQIYARVDGDATKTVYLLSTNPLDSLDKDPSEFRSMELASLDSDKVERLVIERPKQTVELERGPKGWAIVKPLALRADANQVSTILTTLAMLNAEKIAPLPVSSPATGLTPAKLKITAYIKTSPDSTPAIGPATASAPTYKQVSVLLGEFSDHTKKLVYAAPAGSNDALLVSAESFSKLDKDLSALRDPVVMPVDVTSSTSTTIFSAIAKGQPALPVVELSRDGDAWTEKSPDGTSYPADSSVVSTLLRSIHVLRANKFVEAGNLKSIGLDPPMKRITFKVDGHEEEILAGEPQTADPLTPVMRKGDDTVYMVQSPELVALGTASPISLRDKIAIRLRADTLQQIKIAGPAAQFPATLVREDATWRFGKPLPPARAPAPATASAPATSTAPATQKAIEPNLGTVLSLLRETAEITAQKWNGPETLPSTTPDLLLTITTLEPITLTPASQPGTQPSTAPKADVAGPLQYKTITREIKLFKKPTGEWSAFIIGPDGKPGWSFQPANPLIERLTTTDYRIPLPAPAANAPGADAPPELPPGMHFPGQGQ